MLATTRSFRTPRIDECRRHGEEGLYVAGDVGAEGRTRLEFGWTPSERRRVVNGDETTLADYLGTLRAVVWSSADREIFRGSPSHRRRLLDRGVVSVDPEGIEVRSRYREFLKQRRELIARRRRADRATWDRLFARAAAELISARARYAERLERAFRQVRERTDLDLPTISFEYRPSPREGLEGAEAVEAVLARVRERELERGHPLVGPHRDDLDVRWGGRQMTAVVSAGEEKVCGLLLAAAQREVLADRTSEPILLLDDADSDLDEGRLREVWGAFSGAGQTISTTARPEVWNRVEPERRWRVRAGGVTAI